MVQPPRQARRQFDSTADRRHGAVAVGPPAPTAGCLGIPIRRPADQVWSIEELGRRGIFRGTRQSGQKLDGTEEELLRLLVSSDYKAFMRRAVPSPKKF